MRAFRALGAMALGIDLNPGPSNPIVLEGDFHRLPFADAVFDLVYRITRMYSATRLIYMRLAARCVVCSSRQVTVLAARHKPCMLRCPGALQSRSGLVWSCWVVVLLAPVVPRGR